MALQTIEYYFTENRQQKTAVSDKFPETEKVVNRTTFLWISNVCVDFRHQYRPFCDGVLPLLNTPDPCCTIPTRSSPEASR